MSTSVINSLKSYSQNKITSLNSVGESNTIPTFANNLILVLVKD